MDIKETDWGKSLDKKRWYRCNASPSPHPQAMPDIYKSTKLRIHNNTVRAYRQYYVNDKKDIAKWERGRPMPDWYTNKIYKMENDDA